MKALYQNDGKKSTAQDGPEVHIPPAQRCVSEHDCGKGWVCADPVFRGGYCLNPKQRLDSQVTSDPQAGAVPDGITPTITMHVCGTRLCHDGQPHDDLKQVIIRDEHGRAVGGSVACSRCGSTAMSRDLLRLP